MEPQQPDFIESATLRANPGYEVVLFDRLPFEQQQLLNGIQNDPDFYGILRPRQPSRLGAKSVDQATALLFLTLQQPSPLPAYVRSSYGAETHQAVAALVLDGILEIEREGQFVCGADAYRSIYGQQVSTAALGTIARLSLEAIQYAQALEIEDSMRLSARMYFYNRLPVSPRWRRLLPSTEAVFAHLGIAPGGPARTMLDRYWTPAKTTATNDGWSMWRLRSRSGRSKKARLAYKLYISPAGLRPGEVFPAALATLSEMQTPYFKIGNDVFGMFRPDKFVAYFEDYEMLMAVADKLARQLAGCPAQGVPFSAGITENGLLSWGMDPPQPKNAILWQERESWRLWVTNRLAVALLAAKTAETATMAPWQFALERLRLEGVDTETWTPVDTIWQ